MIVQLLSRLGENGYMNSGFQYRHDNVHLSTCWGEYCFFCNTPVDSLLPCMKSGGRIPSHLLVLTQPDRDGHGVCFCSQQLPKVVNIKPRCRLLFSRDLVCFSLCLLLDKAKRGAGPSCRYENICLAPPQTTQKLC